MAKPKTIFISCFFNLAARNILATDFFAFLKSRENLRIVLLSPQKNVDFFQKEFGGSNVLVEGIEFQPLSKVNLILHLLSWHLLSTRSKKIHKLVQLGKDGNYPRYIWVSWLAWLGRWPWVRLLFRWLDYRLAPRGGFDHLFKRHQPDLVLATDIQDLRAQELSDTVLIREAKRNGIATMGLGRSWDSMTTKGLLRTLPDTLVVQTEDIKNQAVRYHSVDPRKVYVAGTPHYDKYINGRRAPRDHFFADIGLKPGGKLVLLVLPSDIWTGDPSLNLKLLRLFADWGEQVVVRFPIFGSTAVGDFRPPASMVFDVPKNSNHLEESLLNRQDDNHLADLIYHSDAVVTGPSSIVVDAAVFGKPAVLIGFDGKKKPYWASIKRYYDYEHQRLVLERGSFPVAGSEDELISLVELYMSNPNIGVRERSRVAEAFCPNKDGQSGLRLAQLVWSILTQKN